MEQIKSWVLTAGAVILALLILATLVRAVLGPRFTDRIVAVNVINTLVIAELVLLSVRLQESFLVDIALVFTPYTRIDAAASGVALPVSRYHTLAGRQH